MEKHYTITSSDHSDYSTIRTSLIFPSTPMTEFMVTGLTTTCKFNVLTDDDFIKIQYYTGDPVIHFMYTMTNFNEHSLLKFFNERFGNRLTFAYANLGRITISSGKEFSILDMSYNLKILLGFYHEKFPLNSQLLHGYVFDKIKLIDEVTTDDYITINGIKRNFEQHYINIPSSELLIYLKKILPEHIRVSYRDNMTGINFQSSEEFEINDISITIKNFLGISDREEFPLFSFDFCFIEASSASYFQLTPVLYLTSNIGTTCYSYDGNNCTNQKILMRVNNHFIPDQPIAAHNFEFSTKIPSYALSDVWFKLVDANFQSVKLLNPMYLSAISMGIPERIIERPILYGEYNSQQSKDQLLPQE